MAILPIRTAGSDRRAVKRPAGQPQASPLRRSPQVKEEADRRGQRRASGRSSVAKTKLEVAHMHSGRDVAARPASKIHSDDEGHRDDGSTPSRREARNRDLKAPFSWIGEGAVNE